MRANLDMGQVVVPGYVDRISGFEMRNPDDRSDATGNRERPANIELAFYKKSTPQGSVVVMVDTSQMKKKSDCIMDSLSGTHPYLYACHSFDWEKGNLPVVAPNTLKPVPVAAVLFTVRPDAAEADQNAACSAAKQVLASFGSHAMDVDSIQWPCECAGTRTP